MATKKKKTPPILYHYTSVETLLKIIENSVGGKICFRATHAKYFNDPYEYNLAISLLKQSLFTYEKNNNIVKGKSSKFKFKIFTNLGLFFGDPFLLSLSENSDNLTMWRTYGADGKGVAIGIDSILLDEYSKDEKIKNTNLLQCKYDKRTILTGLVRYWEFVYDHFNIKENGKGMNLSSFHFLFDLITFSFTFKRNEYKEEKEWRLCKNEISDSNTKFRESDGVLIPYIEHLFDKKIIKKIVVGPCVNRKLTKESIEMFLKTRKFELAKNSIVISKVPYRNI